MLERVAKLRAMGEASFSPKTSQTVAPCSMGRGVSYVKYELVRTYVAAVAEVEVQSASGRSGSSVSM